VDHRGGGGNGFGHGIGRIAELLEESGTGTRKPTSEAHKLRIKISNLEHRVEAAPAVQKAELQEELKGAEGKLAVIERAEKAAEK
jgi:hypothetical protein